MNRAFISHILSSSAATFLIVTTAFAQSKIENSVQSTAGGTASSISFSIVATIGQPSPPGQASAGQFTLSSGFIFTLEVAASANRPPTVANAILNQILQLGGAPFTRNLNSPPVFTDPDGDALTYMASSSATNIATANISGSALTVAPVAAGNATITITASDGRGGSAPTSFGVTVTTAGNQPPAITHTVPSVQPSGQSILIIASVTDDRGLDRVELFYRRSGDVDFVSTRMTFTSGSNYQANIPASFVTSSGVDYYLLATDVDGASTRRPSAPNSIFSIQILVTTAAKPTAQPSGTAQTAYRLVSVPLQLDNPSAAAVLEDDLGSYDNTKWRLFGLAAGSSQNLNTKEPYVEFPNAGANAFTPGASLFLIVKEPGKTITLGAAKSIRTDQRFGMPLQPGHNLIATPFNFLMPVGRLSLKSGGSVSALKTFGGGSGFIPETTALQPWEGYHFPNVNQAVDTLFINPNLSASAIIKTTASGWRLRILARCDEARDDYNFAGVAPESEDGYDDNDLAEPPPIGEFVSLYFAHPEWQKALSRFSDDIRSAGSSNHRWSFRVETNISGAIVKLQFDGLKEIDPALGVFVVDEEMEYKQNLRENAVYQYQSRGAARPREISLIVGKAAFVDEYTAGVPGVPADFELEQNFPNPFNPETAIRFGLPKASVVSIRILDLNGREVAMLLDKVELPAGQYERLWNGRDRQGLPVVSGIYLCQMRAGNFAAAKKLALMK